MAIVVHEIGPDMHAQYARIEASFEVASVLKVVPKDRGLGGLQFVEEAVARAYRKEADSPEDSPLSWPPLHEPGEFAAPRKITPRLLITLRIELLP